MLNSPYQLVELAVSEHYLSHLIDAYQKGEKIFIEPRRDSPAMTSTSQPVQWTGLSGTVNLRVREHGVLSIFAVDTKNHQPLSSRCDVKVSPCDEDVVILPLFGRDLTSPASPSPSSEDANRPQVMNAMDFPTKTFNVKGVLSVTGKTPIVISHESLPGTVPSSRIG